MFSPEQDYFTRVYIVAVSFIGGGNRSTRGNHRTLSQNVVLSTPRLGVIRTHNVGCNRH